MKCIDGSLYETSFVICRVNTLRLPSFASHIFVNDVKVHVKHSSNDPNNMFSKFVPIYIF